VGGWSVAEGVNTAGHLSPEFLQRYGARTLSAAELMVADDHLAICESCRRRTTDSQRMEASISFLRQDLATRSKAEPTHLSYEQLESYVEGAMDRADGEIVDSHAELCSICREELQDLQKLRSGMSGAAISKRWTSAAGMDLWAARIRPWLRPAYWSTAGALVAVVALFAFVQVRQHHVSKPAVASQTTTEANPAVTASATAAELALTTPPELVALIGKPGTLLGQAHFQDSFALLSPVGTFVEDVQPTFQWQPLAGATAYEVSVFDSALNQVAESGQISALAWKANIPLQRMRVYLWQVTATKNGEQIVAPTPPAPEAKFEIIGQAQAKELEHLRSSQPDAHLELGIAYVRDGLLDEAERELQLVPASNANHDLAQKFIEDLNHLRHRE